MILRDGHDEVDATTGRARRQEDHEALVGQVRRDERGGRPSAEVNLVEPETQAAVHLQVWTEHCAVGRRRRHELLPVGVRYAAEVHERLDVLSVHTGDGVTDGSKARTTVTALRTAQ